MSNTSTPAADSAAPAGSASTATSVTNQQSFDRARGVLPGGVNSPVRAFGSVGGTPRFYVKASGAYVTDVEGHSYIASSTLGVPPSSATLTPK